MILIAVAVSYPLLRDVIKLLIGNSDDADFNPANLRYQIQYYETVAEDSFQLMNGSTSDAEEKELIEMVEDLNKDELIAVFNAFGKRRYAVNGSPVFIPWFYEHKNLFFWYNEELESDNGDLQRMKNIWSKTDLWKN